MAQNLIRNIVVGSALLPGIIAGIVIIPLIVSGVIDWWGWLVFLGIALFSVLGTLPFLLALRGGATSKRFRDAPIGIGTLITTRATGMSINDQPQIEFTLEVTRDDGTTFLGTTREIVNVGQLAQLQPGVTLPVRYLPDGAIALAGDVEDDRLRHIAQQQRVAAGLLTPEQVRVAKEGVRAHAVIRSFQPTGGLRGAEAVVRLEMTVTRPDGTTFDATRVLPLPSVAHAGLQPGAVVEARYLPGDESYVGIQTRVA